MNWKKEKSEALIFYLVATILMLIKLSTNPLWGSEDRWAEVARSMCFSGDWLHPAINGIIYFDKPLLSYWPIAILATICGTINEFIVRLPSLLAALIALWGTRTLAQDMFHDRKITILSGWILLGFYGFFFWSRTAAAEMLNLASVIVALAWFFRHREERKFHVYLVFWLICFVGMLAKGMPALILPVAVTIVWVIATGSVRRHLCWQNIAAFPFGLVVGLLPYYLSYKFPMPEYYYLPAHHLNGIELLIRENLTRVFEAFDHNDEPFWIYLVHVPRIILPFTLITLTALIASIIDWKKSSLENRLLWLGCAVIFILFSISESRRWYYILPITPLLAIATANYMMNGKWMNSLVCKIHLYAAWLIGGALTIAGVIVAAILPFTKYAPLFYRFGVFSAIMFLICTAAIFLVAYRYRNWYGITAAAVIAVFAGFGILYPTTGNFRTEKNFAFLLREKLPATDGSEMLFFSRDSAKITFYMGLTRRVFQANDPEELHALLKNFAGKEVYILVPDKPKNLDRLHEALPQEVETQFFLGEDRIDLLESRKDKKWQCYRCRVPADFANEPSVAN